MTTGDLDALREHYDHADTSAELEKAKLDESVISEPMVGITIRLPATALDAARDVARERGIKVTALLREWIEQNLGGEADDDRLVSVRDLKSFIAQKSKTTTRGSKATLRSATSGQRVSKTASTRARTASASATKTMQSRTR